MAWEGRMEVQIRDQTGDVIWSRNSIGGITSTSYGASGILQKIEQALELALEQCRGELAVSDDADGVLDVSGATT